VGEAHQAGAGEASATRLPTLPSPTMPTRARIRSSWASWPHTPEGGHLAVRDGRRRIVRMERDGQSPSDDTGRPGPPQLVGALSISHPEALAPCSVGPRLFRIERIVSMSNAERECPM
jgi:hypothetical protein